MRTKTGASGVRVNPNSPSSGDEISLKGESHDETSSVAASAQNSPGATTFTSTELSSGSDLLPPVVVLEINRTAVPGRVVRQHSGGGVL